MKINGKRENLKIEDLFACGKNMDISDKKIKEILEQVYAVVKEWPQYAERAEMKESHMEEIRQYHKHHDFF